MNIFPDANIFVAAFMWEDGVCGRILEVLPAEGKRTRLPKPCHGHSSPRRSV